MQAKLVASAAIFLFVLAGCSSAEPAGKLENMNFVTLIDAKVDIFYQPFDNGGNPAPPTLPANATCAQNTPSLPADPTGTIRPCKGPYTTIRVSANSPPDPADGTYAAFLTGAGKVPFAVGALVLTGSNYTVAKNETRDLSGQYDKVELRLNDFVYGVASTAAGVGGAFTLAPGANGVTVTGTFTGNTLKVQVSGLPVNGTYMGNLYLNGPDGNVLANAAESFPINGDGSYEYSGKSHQMNEFVQFHIHVGMSKINLYKASIKPDA